MWNEKIDRIKHLQLQGQKTGGLGLIDISCKLLALKLQWLAHYPQTSGRWILLQVHMYWINKPNGSNNLRWYVFANVESFLKTNTTTMFYKELIHAFHEAGGSFERNISCL